MAVNVSSRQFFEGTLYDTVMSALEVHGVAPALLELELTESTLMANTDDTIATLRELKGRGLQISIDDFGTGYSSLAYLCRFPIDKLKVDIAFVRNITTSADDAVVAHAIIEMAHSLGLKAIAEGVETAEQLAHLRRIGCDQVQGYHLSRPVPAGELEALLVRLEPRAPDKVHVGV